MAAIGMHTARRALLVVAVVAALAVSALTAHPSPRPASGPLPRSASAERGGQLLIAAHPDDDLFFMSPDLPRSLRSGVPTTTVYATEGDAGEGFAYIAGRERGVRAAYATMTGVGNEWTRHAYRVAGHVVDVHVLRGRPDVRLVFLHLPDGGVEGDGYATTGTESLSRLRAGALPSAHTLDGRAQTYSAASLVAVLRGLVAWSDPATVRTLDPAAESEGSEEDGDHADHRAIAQFARDAVRAAGTDVEVVSYVGYPVSGIAPNVGGADLAAKQAAFLAYARHDSKICRSLRECATKPEGQWLLRQYSTE